MWKPFIEKRIYYYNWKLTYCKAATKENLIDAADVYGPWHVYETRYKKICVTQKSLSFYSGYPCLSFFVKVTYRNSNKQNCSLEE